MLFFFYISSISNGSNLTGSGLKAFLCEIDADVQTCQNGCFTMENPIIMENHGTSHHWMMTGGTPSSGNPISYDLVGGFNHFDKYESQLG